MRTGHSRSVRFALRRAARAAVLAALAFAPVGLLADELDDGAPSLAHRPGIADGEVAAVAAADADAVARAVIRAAVAARFPLPPEARVQGVLAVADERLANLRGGFENGQGLRVSLGIERAAYVNGALVTHTRFNLPDASRISAAQAREVAAVVGAVQLVQNGAGNLFLPGAAAGAGAATVIQNSLNDQTLRAVTTIDAASNSLQFLKNANSFSTLRDALAAPLSPR